MLYLVGADLFDVDDGPVTVSINRSIEAKSAADHVPGEKTDIKGKTITTNIPGGVMRAIYVETVE